MLSAKTKHVIFDSQKFGQHPMPIHNDAMIFDLMVPDAYWVTIEPI
jgi:hypothetical protein